MGRLAAKFINVINVRTLVLLATLGLMLGPPLPQFLTQYIARIEQAILRTGLYFYELPRVQTEITVVHVPDVEYAQWMVDLPGAARLASLLEEVKPSAENELATTTALVLEEPLNLTQSQAEVILAEIQQGRRTKDHLFNESNDLLARREYLINLLKSNNVVLGLFNQLPSQYQTVNLLDGPLQESRSFIAKRLWPYPPQIDATLQSPVLDYWIKPASSAEQQFLLVRNKERVVSTFWLQFMVSHFNQLNALNEQSIKVTPSWSPVAGVFLGQHRFATGADGSFVALYGDESGIRAPLRQISLGAALAKDSLNGFVLIGRDSSAQLEDAAQVLASLSSGAYIHTPYWWVFVVQGLLLTLGLFLCFVAPRIRWRWLTFVIPFSLFCLTVLQLVGQAVYQYWLPCGLLMLYVVVTFGSMILWRWQNDYLNRLNKRADRASLNLADSLMITGQLQMAFSYAKECRNNPEVFEKLYKIAERQERQHEWHKAVKTWEELRRRRWRYKDVGERLRQAKLQAANSLNAGPAKPTKKVVAPAKLTRTLPLDKNSAAPVVETTAAASLQKFGRYEVKKEIGRGASGTVYLCFDPMISREVAVKTVRYEQFPKAEKQEVKARFFREAEAAGRLSHPNIVPVYDIGEEGESAFIAMDLAPGAALSEYTHQDQLLPVFSVYRIVLEVAEALVYAHEKKVIHRDIKPANVLYSVEPFSVRITDFGIARIIDHSHTRTGEILGSPLYMSPEQVLGKRVDSKSDIFSLGVMFYQLLTGYLPFSGESLASVSYEIVHGKHKSARSQRKELPASATRITNVCLQKKPADRYTGAEALVEALRKAMRRDFADQIKQANIQI